MTTRKIGIEWPEDDRWWEQEKIVVWWQFDLDRTEHMKGLESLGCGNTPEEVIDFMARSSYWGIEKFKEVQNTQKRWTRSPRARQRYMEKLYSRLSDTARENFVLTDAESFLLEMVKIGILEIEKWDF